MVKSMESREALMEIEGCIFRLDSLIEKIQSIENDLIKAKDSIEKYHSTIEEKMVPKPVLEQVIWERYVMEQQLSDLGYQFGEKPRTGKWILADKEYFCTECGESIDQDTFNKYGKKFFSYCSSCGCKMIEDECV